MAYSKGERSLDCVQPCCRFPEPALLAMLAMLAMLAKLPSVVSLSICSLHPAEGWSKAIGLFALLY
jgi:hypothetical protein